MKFLIVLFTLFMGVACSNMADKAEKVAADKMSCEQMGPQTPRDISQKEGTNSVKFETAPSFSKMNLCNIHFHKNAEHKGPEFSVFKGDEPTGGYACNKTTELTEAQLTPAQGACKGVAVGDTVEVHWVHSSCDIKPGPTLGSCLAEDCKNPVLKVETQVFVLVNDGKADDFMKFDYKGPVNGFHQANMLPSRYGAVQFLGSTTGPKYDNKVCSPFKVNWSVTPGCKTLNINTLHKWCESNVFNENKAHGVRKLVTDKKFLSEIK